MERKRRQDRSAALGKCKTRWINKTLDKVSQRWLLCCRQRSDSPCPGRVASPLLGRDALINIIGAHAGRSRSMATKRCVRCDHWFASSDQFASVGPARCVCVGCHEEMQLDMDDDSSSSSSGDSSSTSESSSELTSESEHSTPNPRRAYNDFTSGGATSRPRLPKPTKPLPLPEIPPQRNRRFSAED